MSVDYYKIMKNHYSSANLESQQKSEMIKEVSEFMDTQLPQNYTTGYNIKSTMVYYKKKAIINSVKEVDCVISGTRLKERVYNSLARNIQLPIGEIKTGDYVTINDSVDGKNDFYQTYIVRSRIDRKQGYDETFILACGYSCKLLDELGNIHTFHLNFSDNRDRMKITESANIISDLTSYECYIQNNQITSEKLAIGNRVLIWDDLAQKYHPLEIKGTAPFSMKGLITINFNNSQIIDGEDNLELGIADYKKQMAKVISPPPLYDIILGEDEVYIDSPYLECEYNLTSVIEPYTNSWSLETLIDGVTLVPYDKNKCYLGIANKPILVNKIIVLRATLNGVVYTKEIKIRGY